MRGFAMVYGQCLEEVKEKLKGSSNWDQVQTDQSLYDLIKKIKRI